MSTQSYDEIMAELQLSRELGDDWELREQRRWTVHCKHCGVQLIGDTPQTDKSFAALKRLVAEKACRNPNCVSNGGEERRRVRYVR